MADENKTESKAQTKSKAGQGAKAGKAAAAKADAPATDGPKCSAPKCKLEVRAKGLCRKHFMGWRRGEIGKKHRYKICSKEACRKPRALGGLCAEHSAKAKPAEGGAA